MMKNLRQSKGITLIALVITIIVLLILAGVAISMLAGENGIITKTNSAKEENKRATVDEQVKLAAMAALVAGNGKIEGADAFRALNDGLKDAGYDGTINEADVTWPVTITVGDTSLVISQSGAVSEPTTIEKLKGGEALDTTTTLKDADGKQVVIPAEFKIAENSASLVKDGIVVIAPDESEFVWVPLNDYGDDGDETNDINSMVMCQAYSETSKCNIVKGDDGELKCDVHTTDPKPICGKLYATSTGEKFDSSLTAQSYEEKSGLREPAVLTDPTYGGDYVTGDDTKGVELIKSRVGITGDTDQKVLDTWKENLQDEFNDMAKSVYENKGFYVGRYETSLDETTKEAQSKANKPSATAATTINDKALTWYGLYQIEKDYNKKEYEEGKTLENIVGSTMIWGSQYDQMMLWMKAKGLDIDVPQNESPNLGGGVEKNTNSTTTGVDGDKDKLNNVYDLLGCKYEWTLEANGTYLRVSRGGYYNSSNSYSPGYRIGNFPYTTTSSSSSRATLYIK